MHSGLGRTGIDMSEATSRKERGSALEKALLILEAIAAQPQPIGLPDLTARVGLPRQTVHRVLAQLEENGLVIKDVVRDRFSVGPRLSRLSLASLASDNQGAPMRAVLQGLVDEIRETCNVGVLDGLEYLYLERIECEWSLRVHLQAGSRVPPHCTAGGKLLLAFMDDELRARSLAAMELEPYTEKTLTDSGQLESAFETIRNQGYSLNDEEYSIGIVGIAVPVRDKSGRPLAALAVHAPVARLGLTDAVRHLPSLQAAADRLAKAWHLDKSDDELAA